MKTVSLVLFLLLVATAAGRSLMLNRRGVKAFVFGGTHKSDALLVVPIAFLVYSLLADIFSLPFPRALLRPLYSLFAVQLIGIIICLAGIALLALSLVSFGDSFRIGIDDKNPDKLITTGLFAISRNPVYLSFLAFFIGLLLTKPTTSILLFIVFFFTIIHRQVLREEKFLRGHYGREYEDYCGRVRRYL